MSFVVVLIVTFALLSALIIQGREADRQARESTLANLETRAREAQRRVRESWWRASALQNEAAWNSFQAASESTRAAFAAWAQEAKNQENWAEEARVSEVFWSAYTKG